VSSASSSVDKPVRPNLESSDIADMVGWGLEVEDRDLDNIFLPMQGRSLS
jgi:hypothetical protein